MKRKLLITAVLLLFIVVIAACGSDGDNQGSANNIFTYNETDFNIVLPNTSEDMVNISPDGKTIYAYFTGIG